MEIRFCNLWRKRNQPYSSQAAGLWLMSFRMRPIWYRLSLGKGKRIIASTRDGRFRDQWVSYAILIFCNLYLFVSWTDRRTP